MIGKNPAWMDSVQARCIPPWLRRPPSPLPPLSLPPSPPPPTHPPTDIVVILLILGVDVLPECGGELLSHLYRKGRDVLAELLDDGLQCEHEVLVLNLGPEGGVMEGGGERWSTCPSFSSVNTRSSFSTSDLRAGEGRGAAVTYTR